MMRWGRRGLILSMVATLGLGAGTVSAGSPSTWYVAPTGSGGGSCATPDFTSIQDAIDASGRRDTILVCPGRYVESFAVTKARHEGLSIRAVVAHRAVVRMPATAGLGGVGVYIDRDHVRVRGLRFELSRRAGCASQDQLLFIGYAKGVVIRGNVFSGKDAGCPSLSVLFDIGDRSWIGYNTVRSWVGSGFSSGGTMVRNSVRIKRGARGLIGGKVVGNAVTDTGRRKGDLEVGIEAFGGADVRGNRVASTGVGIFVQPVQSGFVIRQNRVLDSVGDGIRLVRTSGGTVTDNIVLRSGGTDCVDYDPLAPSVWTGNVGATSSPDGLCTPPS